MLKGKKITEATRKRMAAAQKKRYAKKILPLVEVRHVIPNSIINAVEFGFRCHEKGMNLEAAINAAFETILNVGQGPRGAS